MPLDTAAAPGQVQARGLSPLGTHFSRAHARRAWEPRNCDSPSTGGAAPVRSRGSGLHFDHPCPYQLGPLASRKSQRPHWSAGEPDRCTDLTRVTGDRRGLCWPHAGPAVPTPDSMAQKAGNGATQVHVLSRRALVHGRGSGTPAPRQGGHRGSTLLVQSLGPFLSGGSISILLTVCYVPLTPEFSGTLFLPILIICQGEWGRQEINRVRFTISYVLDFHTGVPMNPGDFPDLIHA